jgi:hypothetical protein
MLLNKNSFFSSGDHLSSGSFSSPLENPNPGTGSTIERSWLDENDVCSLWSQCPFLGGKQLVFEW